MLTTLLLTLAVAHPALGRRRRQGHVPAARAEAPGRESGQRHGGRGGPLHLDGHLAIPEHEVDLEAALGTPESTPYSSSR